MTTLDESEGHTQRLEGLDCISVVITVVHDEVRSSIPDHLRMFNRNECPGIPKHDILRPCLLGPRSRPTTMLQITNNLERALQGYYVLPPLAGTPR